MKMKREVSKMNAVVYVSKGGNTEKLAHAAAKGAGVAARPAAQKAPSPR
jgi:flavodoxin